MQNSGVIPPPLAAADFCYLTTTGRVTGRAHTIEIWFAAAGDSIYLLSGGGERSDWVRNLRRDPDVRLRIGECSWDAKAEIVTSAPERHMAAELVFSKYQAGYGGDLTAWRDASLLVKVTPARAP
jgi:deazaflavin-dependent oxidoreductase (nitroreductase family)